MADAKCKVNVRRRTKPVSRGPRITGIYTKGDQLASRSKNKDVLREHPEIQEYIKNHLSSDLTQMRTTLVPERNKEYIVPALNKVGTGFIKYIFGQAKDKDSPAPAPAYPWEKIEASYWTQSKPASILIGTGVVYDHLVLSALVLQECINIRYYQYHVYRYSRSFGRCDSFAH
jgi:hypothetical protein